ncbi:hypothetical protein HHI36_024402, partial [Cryptolaemus montrouzieri]
KGRREIEGGIWKQIGVDQHCNKRFFEGLDYLRNGDKQNDSKQIKIKDWKIAIVEHWKEYLEEKLGTGKVNRDIENEEMEALKPRKDSRKYR